MVANDQRVAHLAKERLLAGQSQIQDTLKAVEAGRPLQAEPMEMRAVERVQAVVKVDEATARKIVQYQDPTALRLSVQATRRAEAIQGKTVDYVGTAWLDAARTATRAVARIVTRGGSAIGTGFLVSPRLLITNRHVIEDEFSAEAILVEFAYETGLDGEPPSPAQYRLAPGRFWLTDTIEGLDYTLVALGEFHAGTRDVQLGACPLSASSTKHSVGELVNVVQHPDGDTKQVVVRENRIVNRGDFVLHYLADTEPGSSGSPVFNDDWQVVALHHWGGEFREVFGTDGPSRECNEGIRVSQIVADLKQKRATLTSFQQKWLDEALVDRLPGRFGTRMIALDSEATLPASPPPPASASSQPIGTADAGPGLEKNKKPDQDYSNRRGYDPGFLPGFPVELPALGQEHLAVAARVSGVGPSANPYELKYQHFSAVVNGARRMPFYTACNIDGGRRVSVNRDTLKATPESAEAAEATETWYVDPRIPESAQLNDDIYAAWRKLAKGKKDFFARGHMTRREDPNWGDVTRALRANADTYHHTNGCPQAQNAFNGSGIVWLGIENYVLLSADDADQRISVFTGPIFHPNDPKIEGLRVPRQFWKIVARVEDGEPVVFALKADQSAAIETILKPGSEAAWDWPAQLSETFRSTVVEIAELTGLDFGELAQHDVFASAEALSARPLTSASDLAMALPRSRGSFGRFTSIGAFLAAWERRQRADAAGESKKPRKPAPKKRHIVEARVTVLRVFGDDLNGSKHQQFNASLLKADADPAVKTEVDDVLKSRRAVRVVVRFGDSQGIADRVPGIVAKAELELKGEWIPAKDAYDAGGEDVPVLHFTHDPLGFICTPAKCYS